MSKYFEQDINGEHELSVALETLKSVPVGLLCRVVDGNLNLTMKSLSHIVLASVPRHHFEEFFQRLDHMWNCFQDAACGKANFELFNCGLVGRWTAAFDRSEPMPFVIASEDQFGAGFLWAIPAQGFDQMIAAMRGEIARANREMN